MMPHAIDVPEFVGDVVLDFRFYHLEDKYFHRTVKKALCRMFVNTRVLRPRKKMPLMPSSHKGKLLSSFHSPRTCPLVLTSNSARID